MIVTALENRSMKKSVTTAYTRESTREISSVMIYEGRGDVDGYSYISLLFVAVCLHADSRYPLSLRGLKLFFFPRISFCGCNSVLRRSMSKAT